eukprot:TRINITY_DN3160_c0_g1_i1.p1 TRINITY_DN3160_c0_g1~~TRINITY_DN3160_c0_g1_i1.p1  ORF type:complete len:137 (-),score=25.55 TRINITY_DN3160_c0_g1_i1:155-565(-)
MASFLSMKFRNVVVVSHLLFVLAFLLYLPFVFEDMPMQSGLGGIEEMPLKGEYDSMVGAAGMRLDAEDETLRSVPAFVEDKTGATAKSCSDGQVEGEDGVCEGVQSGPRLTLVPFLLALVGGGVFSLEAFDALPIM